MKLIRGPLPTWKLENQADGRRLAIWALRSLEDAGPEFCRADIQAQQVDALIRAYDELFMRGTRQASIGFVSILTDMIGTGRRIEGAPALYAMNFDKWRNWRSRPRAVADFDWGALNPGRKARETDPLPEGREAPESTGPGKARSPAPDSHVTPDRGHKAD